MHASFPYQPTVFNPAKRSDWNRVASLREDSGIRCIDEIEGMLDELFAIRHPGATRGAAEDRHVAAFKREIAGTASERYRFGMWVWYPWNRTLIHFLPEALHTELRTSRNRNLITEEEQRKYYDAHIGVAGLSVGNAVVGTLLHAGAAKNLRIADHDTLSGSNINRIRAGFDSLGLPKTVVAAREVFSVNPYASVAVYNDGLTKKNIPEFLAAPLAVVIDEMDSLYLKVQLRLEARNRRIPVIMAADNGDGIVVDIERFDKHPDIPLMHGKIPESVLRSISPATSRPEAARIISSWVGPENIADRMKDSLLELGRTLYTWPQLGNAAFMAGSVLAYVARKIILDEPLAEGKIVIQPDAFLVPAYRSAAQQRSRRQKTVSFMRAVGL